MSPPSVSRSHREGWCARACSANFLPSSRPVSETILWLTPTSLSPSWIHTHKIDNVYKHHDTKELHGSHSPSWMLILVPGLLPIPPCWSLKGPADHNKEEMMLLVPTHENNVMPIRMLREGRPLGLLMIRQTKPPAICPSENLKLFPCIGADIRRRLVQVWGLQQLASCYLLVITCFRAPKLLRTLQSPLLGRDAEWVCLWGSISPQD